MMLDGSFGPLVNCSSMKERAPLGCLILAVMFKDILFCVKVKTPMSSFGSFWRLFFHFSKRQCSCNVTVSIGYSCLSQVFNRSCINGLQQDKVKATLSITFLCTSARKSTVYTCRYFLDDVDDCFLAVILLGGTKRFPYIM